MKSVFYLLTGVTLVFLCFLRPADSTERDASQKLPAPFPVTIVHSDGYGTGNGQVSQVFDRPPRRIMCIEPQTAQVLISMGLAPLIAGATKSVGHVNEKYRDRFEQLNFLADILTPAREVVVALRPDIIIGWGSTFGEKLLGSARLWHEKGIHTYAMSNTVPGKETRTMERFYTDLDNLGQIFNIRGKTHGLIREMKTGFEFLAKQTAPLKESDKLKVLTVAHVWENEFYGRSERDLVSDLIRRAGGIPLDKSPGRQSIEKLMVLNPDAILIIDRLDTTFAQKKSAILSHPSLTRIEAVKNNRFVSIPYVEFYGGVIESVQTCQRIAAALYPHLFDGKDEKP